MPLLNLKTYTFNNMKQQTEPHYRTGNVTKKKHEEK